VKILILYYSKTGHTLEAANATVEGIRSAGSEADLVRVEDFSASMVIAYDGLIVGSPCWAGSITPNGVAVPVQRALDGLAADSLKGKRCGGIVVHSWMGGKTTERQLGKILAGKGCEDYRPGPVAKAGVPFSAWTGPAVKPRDEERFKTYGAAFVS